ncbi:MAG: QcrA and Rieske domain-containing protein [Planctomycetota bacterium]|jgi:Rieske Fe-S protein
MPDPPSEGLASRFTYEVQAGWETRREVGFLVRRGGRILALSALCTHARCRVRFQEGEFRCPCHGGVFSLAGEVLKGPPEKPLARFATKIEDGRVKVQA